MSLKSIDHEGVYYNPGEVVNQVVQPALKISNKLDIIAGYFTIESLLEVAEGLEVFLNSSGKIDLIIGVPQKGLDSMNENLVEALKLVDNPMSIEEIKNDFEKTLHESAKNLVSELQKDKIRVVAYLIEQKILNIKFAIKAQGVVHAKVYIFHDSQDNKLVVNGSMNPTRQGFMENTDNNNIDTSWEDRKKVDKHTSYQQKLWQNQVDGIEILDASGGLAEKLMSSVGDKEIDRIIENLTNSKTLSNLYTEIIDSPVWLEYTLGKASLYPHQTNAVQETLSSWPMRNLFADEVGLGKTLEVGACIAYAVKHLGIKRILILTPASVVHQWQSELKEHFGLDNFYARPKNKKIFLDMRGNEKVVENQDIYSEEFPEFCIMSKDTATKSLNRHIFKESSYFPQMLVVDEAHHARGQRLSNGDFTSTQYRDMLQDVCKNVEHLLFASATPMRKSFMEYYFLLDLLGLGDVLDEKDYEFTLIDLGKEISKIDPVVFGRIFKILKTTINLLNYPPKNLSDEEINLFTKIKTNEINEVNILQHLSSEDFMLNLLIRIHPTTLFTTRHFRDTLNSYDTYSFPNRKFSTDEINEEEMPEELNELFSQIVSYAENYYLKTEGAFGRFTSRKLGVASFKEAFVSSYIAAKSRLENRKEKLQDYIDSYSKKSRETITEITFVDDFDTEDENTETINLKADFDPTVIVENAKQELIEVKNLLELCHEIDKLDVNISPDPKMVKLIDILSNHFKDEKRKPILVFSRYLSTLDEATKLTEEHIFNEIEGIGYYKGGGNIAVKYSGLNEWEKSSREEIKEDLESGNIEIIFCSTAAQEGVNLQSAASIINLDVPWIPSDLEQRIGRIARLGQKERVVNIYNLWYPNSYEAKIYKRLLQRMDLLELALGKFPDIVSDAIKEQTYGESDIVGIENVIEKLSDLKNETSTIALAKLWTSNSDSIRPFSNDFRENLINYFSYFDQDIKNMISAPGEKNSASLRKTNIASIFKNYQVVHDNPHKVYTLKSERGLLGFEIEIDNQQQIINPYCLPALIKGLLSTDVIEIDYFPSENFESDVELLSTYRILFQEWLIPFHDNFNSDNEYQHDLKETRVFRDYLGTVSLGLKLEGG